MKKVCLPISPHHVSLTGAFLRNGPLPGFQREQYLTPTPEQENLIRTLVQQNANVNILYIRILLAVPILSIIPYVGTLFNARTSFLSILSISSLLCTTYLLYSLPPSRTNIPILDSLNAPKSTTSSPHSTRVPSRIQFDGPIAQYLPLLNLGLGIVLGLLGMVFRGREEVWWGFGWLPAGDYAVVLLAKVVMGGVDPEAELGDLRYGFKGA